MDMKEAVWKTAELWSGFYCIICDAWNQNMLYQFWETSNEMSEDRLYFNREFCSSLVQNNIKSSFNLILYIKRYLENLNILFNCSTGKNQIIEYEIPLEKKADIRNCYYYHKKFFFYFCERYCENFDLTKPDPIFDGDIV